MKPEFISPMKPETLPELSEIKGLSFVGLSVGLKKNGTPDLFVAFCEEGGQVALVATRSKTRSAPVDWCREAIAHSQGAGRVIIANSGNANAFTGAQGKKAVRATVDEAARLFGCPASEILIASTGVIGERLHVERIVQSLALARDAAKAGEGDAQARWVQATQAIMTTDTYPKIVSRRIRIESVEARIMGIAKGSGMIAPDMGTMLAFLFTDAPIHAHALDSVLRNAVRHSFNCITVDSDTSTSDMATLMATGRVALPSGPVTSPSDRRLAPFRKAVRDISVELARQIVMDGEGATKLIEIRVRGGRSNQAAHRIGLAIGNSPLVKTAIAGEDANWGRIVMAIGKAGEEADRDRLAIAIGGVTIAENGVALAGYDEQLVQKHLRGSDILIEVDLQLSRGVAVVWTCDLTQRYIQINGSYRS